MVQFTIRANPTVAGNDEFSLGQHLIEESWASVSS
jgi:hypothetical protein